MSGIKIETYFFDGTEQHNDNKKLILVIYDIVSDKRRTKFVKFVEKYGFRVQKSAFEMILDSSKYNQLIAEIPRHITQTKTMSGCIVCLLPAMYLPSEAISQKRKK